VNKQGNKKKDSFEVNIPTEVLLHIDEVNIPVNERQLKDFCYSIANGAGVGYTYYFVDNKVHPKLIKYLSDKFDSFNTVLKMSIKNAKQKHDNYLAFLISTNNLTRVNFERDKFIYQLNYWESYCTADDLTLDKLGDAVLRTKNLYEAGIICGLELEDILDFQSNERINTVLKNIID
jgi:hypothetical protein